MCNHLGHPPKAMVGETLHYFLNECFFGIILGIIFYFVAVADMPVDLACCEACARRCTLIYIFPSRLKQDVIEMQCKAL